MYAVMTFTWVFSTNRAFSFVIFHYKSTRTCLPCTIAFASLTMSIASLCFVFFNARIAWNFQVLFFKPWLVVSFKIEMSRLVLVLQVKRIALRWLSKPHLHRCHKLIDIQYLQSVYYLSEYFYAMLSWWRINVPSKVCALYSSKTYAFHENDEFICALYSIAYRVVRKRNQEATSLRSCDRKRSC